MERITAGRPVTHKPKCSKKDFVDPIAQLKRAGDVINQKAPLRKGISWGLFDQRVYSREWCTSGREGVKSMESDEICRLINFAVDYLSLCGIPSIRG
jgi:hypothetical protein